MLILDTFLIIFIIDITSNKDANDTLKMLNLCHKREETRLTLVLE